MKTLEGIGVSAGIAIGRAVVIETRGPDVFRLHVPEE
jgi:phosphoenolpyruvate-protein kinase (PTS system EI component)